MLSFCSLLAKQGQYQIKNKDCKICCVYCMNCHLNRISNLETNLWALLWVIFWIRPISVEKHTLAAGLIQHHLSTNIHLCRLLTAKQHDQLLPQVPTAIRGYTLELWAIIIPGDCSPWNCEPELAIFHLSCFCQFILSQDK